MGAEINPLPTSTDRYFIIYKRYSVYEEARIGDLSESFSDVAWSEIKFSIGK